ncbi:MAG: protein phosphatase 2C domain-containing protein [Desulfobacterales bacterium]|nr:protein phosphatase 2C domain-containing protein [Desulfobacterales bacterium]
MIIAASAGQTDVGKKRKGNEDAFLIDEGLGLYVVADGMGGRKAGEVASRLVVETLQRTLRKLAAADNPAKMVGFDRNLSTEANQLIYSIRRANLKTFDYAQNDETCKGMGSTLSAVLLSNNQIVVSNVGDSPIFRVRAGATETVSTIHTVMAEQEAIAPEGGLKLGQQYLHMITRAMGISETVNPDTRELDCRTGDIFVICSDGLSDKAFPEEIGEIVQRETPDAACAELIKMANDRGGDDNITVVVVRVDSLAESHEAPAGGSKAHHGVTAHPERRVLIEYDTEDASYSTYSRTLRLDGVFLETAEPISEGESLMMNITDPGEEVSVMVSGLVVGRTPQGIEVAFENLTAAQIEELKALIRRL